jgi:tetratricopeptide repeat protein
MNMRTGVAIAVMIACSSAQPVEGGPASTPPATPATRGAGGASGASGAGGASGVGGASSAGGAGGASGASAAGNSKEAKAANARGLALQKQKKYAAAQAEYRKAIALDPGYVLAHYNLACAATLAGDLETSLIELAWVGNRAAWDDRARAAALKETSDPDLRGLADAENPDQWVPPNVLTVVDVLGKRSAAAEGHLLTDAERARLAAPLAAAPGAHAAECDPADAKQGRVFGLPLTSGRVAKHAVAASLRDGIALFDPGGTQVARSEPIGCTAPGASQDQLTSLAYLPGTLVSLSFRAPTVPEDLYVVQYSAGGRAQWTTNAAIFARRDHQLVRVFDAVLTSSDAAGAGTLVQTVLGDLVYVAPGQNQKRAFHWDPAAFTFAPAT